jgi:hypothetical protein
MLTVERGIVPSMMAQYKRAARSGDAVTADEDRKILGKAISMLKDEFDGAESESGLAKLRNAIAKSRKAAARNWTFTAAADRAAHGILGPRLDGKGGTLAKVEQHIRNSVRSGTFSPY